MSGVEITKNQGTSAQNVGYNSYIALLSQSGTSAPTAIIGNNTLASVPVWTRVSAGFYTLTLASAFPLTKTYIILGTNANGGLTFFYDVQSSGAPNSFNVYIRNAVTGIMSDDLLTYNPIEIKVYP
jgi:hypothetical protein